MVNGVNVTQMDRKDIVQLIKTSGNSIKLVVQQPESECSPFKKPSPSIVH